MPTDHRAALATIKRFDQLIAYLRDEMGWPIARDSFEEVDDLFYDFTADELGIDPKTAAKIESIKRLKPLSTRQPWGIFFVKFEPRKLPVMALRRILSQVALKKRTSANSAERTAWAKDDVLFVSNYGEGDQRQISFAHFSTPSDGHDLPTLRVLGWDNRDTALHLDAVARELTEHLAWPLDDSDASAWRAQWRAAFTLRNREVVTTSRELSICLAELARAIRDRIKTALAFETERGPLTKLMKAFQTSLVHDLDAGGFADMYAQTIAYGLLSARIADPHKKTVDDFAGHMRTNPFLRELMETFLKVGGRRGKAGGPGIDFDELGVSEVVQLLDDANMEAVVRDFGDKNPQEDPVIHFYELFLKEYDAKKRMQRGVFYTPRPVVSYIVRSVDELLRAEFGLEDGLADTTTWGEMAKRHKDLKIPEGIPHDQSFVQILDPATGTGTFLVEVIDIIHKTMVAKWKAHGHGEKKIASLWNEYVPKHLLTRLHAYELLMAPYAIAHLKVGLKLYETGYRFGSDERARIYLTNALEPAQDFSGTFEFAIPALACEAQAGNEIKRHKRFTVVVGNPPYAGHSANASVDDHGEPTHIGRLLKSFFEVDGAPLGERNPKWLQDDYVKFVRSAQSWIVNTGVGVLGFITNHGYLDNPTFRGMREKLIRSFGRIALLDLHGNSNKRERTPEGGSDENVFDIQQGVAIGLFVRRLPHNDSHHVTHGDLWGERETKYEALLRCCPGLHREDLPAAAPDYLFFPQDNALGGEYLRGVPLPAAMPVNTVGIVTGQDAETIGVTRPDADELAKKHKLPWSCVQRTLYRPMDRRFIVYSQQVVTRPREDVMRHMLAGPNIGLITTRSTKDMWDVYVTDSLSGHKTCSAYDINYIFPLYIYEHSLDFGGKKVGGTNSPTQRPNFNARFLKALAATLQLPGEGPHGLPTGLTPEDIFHYAYAVFHSPGYRSRYAEFLKIDFPRLPLTGSLELFRALARLGGELVALHLLESPKLAQCITEFVGGRNPEVEKVSWSRNTVWVDKGQTTGFKGVREAVWNFHIGGYQVCEKWLKDRKGRTLSKDDIAHYQKVVVALNETIRLMKEIDVVIEQHGGWPGAFATGTATPEAYPPASAATETSEPLSGAAPDLASEYTMGPPPLRKVAEDQSDFFKRSHEVSERSGAGEPAGPEEWMSVIRQVFAAGGPCEREAAISDLAREVGFERVGSRVREDCDAAIRTAVRRGILDNEGGQLRLLVRSIEGYEREFLKDQLLASLGGKAWTERDDAARGLARWMGFRRTGAAIEETVKSLVNGLLREGRLEAEGSRIRKAN
jgi:hypothetical protein